MGRKRHTIDEAPLQKRPTEHVVAEMLAEPVFRTNLALAGEYHDGTFDVRLGPKYFRVTVEAIED